MWNRNRDYRRAEREMRPAPRMHEYGGDFRHRSGPPGHGREYAQFGYGRDFRPSGYGRDYWWIGEHAMQQRGGYDPAYRRFDRETRPRYSPVGGMYPPVGGWTSAGHAPAPLRDYRHFSDWTRWF